MAEKRKPETDTMLRGFMGNALPVSIVAKGLGALARIIKGTGALEKMQEKADETANPLDDLLIRIVVGMIDTVASF